jgi:hypothetical protein
LESKHNLQYQYDFTDFLSAAFLMVYNGLTEYISRKSCLIISGYRIFNLLNSGIPGDTGGDGLFGAGVDSTGGMDSGGGKCG